MKPLCLRSNRPRDELERMDEVEVDLARAGPLTGPEVFWAETTELDAPPALRVLCPLSALSFKNIAK